MLSYLKAVDIEPSLLEGDIRLASYPDDRNASKLREKRAARRLRHYVWTSKIVPYEISSELGKLLWGALLVVFICCKISDFLFAVFVNLPTRGRF